MGRLACWTLVFGLAVPAQAQVSVVSELWREWAVLQRQLRDARDEAARERLRLKTREDARRRAREGKTRDE